MKEFIQQNYDNLKWDTTNEKKTISRFTLIFAEKPLFTMCLSSSFLAVSYRVNGRLISDLMMLTIHLQDLHAAAEEHSRFQTPQHNLLYHH